MDPSVGLTPSGERIVAWNQLTPPMTSDGIAVRFAPADGDFLPATVFPGSAGGSWPTVATGVDDNAAVAWISADKLHIARRTPGATSFTEAPPIAAPGVFNPPAVAVQGGSVFVAVNTDQHAGDVETTAVRLFELPAGATAIEPIPGQAAGGAVAGESWNTRTGTQLQAIDPRIVLANGDVNVVWQKLSGMAGATPASTTISAARRSIGGGGSIGAGAPVATVNGTRQFADFLPVAVAGNGEHVVVAWSRSDAIAFTDIAARSPATRTLPVTATFDLRAGIDSDGNLTFGWDRREPLEDVDATSVVTVPGGGAPGDPVRVSTPGSGSGLADLLVAPDGSRLTLLDRTPVDEDSLSGHVQGAFAAPGGGFGALEQVTGVQDRTGIGRFSAAHAALGGGRAIAVSTADDETGVTNQRVYLAERDATPPVFGAVDVPATTQPGTRIAFAAGATDALTPVRIDWDFGDGSGAEGATASHAYGAPGNFTVTVRAHDAAGNVAVQTRAVAVAAPPGRGAAAATPGTVVTAPPDHTPPRITSLTTTNARFRVGAGSTELIGAATKRSPAGTVFRVGVDERATLVLTFTGKLSGRKKGSRCIAGRTTGRRCTIAVAPGTLLRSARAAGVIAVPFSGRIGGVRLEPGSYRLAVSAIDASGNRSRSLTVPFTVASR